MFNTLWISDCILLRARAMFYVLCKSERRRNVNGRYGRYRNLDFNNKKKNEETHRDDARRRAKCAIKVRNDTLLNVNIDCTIALLGSEYARLIFNNRVMIKAITEGNTATPTTT